MILVHYPFTVVIVPHSYILPSLLAPLISLPGVYPAEITKFQCSI